MPRFVIQEHRLGQDVHWDLMLEVLGRDKLATWQIAHDPAHWPGRQIPCARIAEHRREYLDYQGEVSNNRGHVHPVDQGRYEPLEISAACWCLRLHGRLLQGVLCLQRTAERFWELIYTGDKQ